MSFKEYVMSILYISIFGIILELFLPNTKLKKYVSSFVSLIIIITIISPIFNVLEQGKIEEVLDSALLAISNNTSVTSSNKVDFSKYIDTTIVSRVKANLEQELYDNFSSSLENITEVEKVEVKLDNDYHIQEVNVYISEADLGIAKVILDKIISEYEVPSSMLKVIN